MGLIPATAATPCDCRVLILADFPFPCASSCDSVRAGGHGHARGVTVTCGRWVLPWIAAAAAAPWEGLVTGVASRGSSAEPQDSPMKSCRELKGSNWKDKGVNAT